MDAHEKEKVKIKLIEEINSTSCISYCSTEINKNHNYSNYSKIFWKKKSSQK